MSTEASGRDIKCQESDLLAPGKPLSILIKTQKRGSAAMTFFMRQEERQ